MSAAKTLSVGRVRLAAAAAAAGFLLAVIGAAPAAAGQVLVRPAKLRPEGSQQQDTRRPFAVGSRTAGAVYFWAPLRLPAGAVVKRVVYQHAKSGGAGETAVWLWRSGSFGDQFLEEAVVEGGSSAVTGGPYLFTPVSIGPLPGTARVKAGWRYAVEAMVANTTTALGWIKVVYE